MAAAPEPEESNELTRRELSLQLLHRVAEWVRSPCRRERAGAGRLFRTTYQGTTLRDHHGCRAPSAATPHWPLSPHRN
ncbi:hypothetical protein GCM10009654_25500 [Streptomyces hebeiensis]|uniref:Uncharacterized protein n=1 Tax=Streptomyces hebeiensis TaxID=229486 RepID=A0ABN1UTL5_9ACTN